MQNSDVWRSPDGINWTLLTDTPGWSPRRNLSAVIFDGKLWILGGSVYQDHLNDVWNTENGVDWTEVTGSAPWSPRESASAVVFDNKIWLLGGFQYHPKTALPTLLGEVWTSEDGVNWIEMSPSSDIWSPRASNGAVVLDNRIWVLGGWVDVYTSAAAEDVWFTEDGQTWVLEDQSPGWLARQAAASVVHDNKIFLTGGWDGYSSRLSDTWYGELK